jgi:hypothetical protein
MSPIICKHIFATAKAAMQKRQTIGVTASIFTDQDDPVEPKNRNPQAEPLKTPQKGRRTPQSSATAARATGRDIPSTWLGRLYYILFGKS